MRLLALCLLGCLTGFGLARLDAARKRPHRESTYESPARPTQTLAERASLAAPDARHRLDAALKQDDPLLCAQRMMEWICSSTREEFAEFAKDPAKIPSLPLFAFNEELESAYYDALAKRWFEVDPQRALSSIFSLGDQRKGEKGLFAQQQDLKILLGAARAEPMAFIESMPSDMLTDARSFVMREAFVAMGARDPNVARSLLDRLANPEVRRAAEISLIKGIAQSDPLAAVAAGKKMREKTVYQDALAAAERIGPGMVRQTAAAIGQDLVEMWGLENLALRYPGIFEGVEFPADRKGKASFSNEIVAQADRLSPEERQETIGHLEEFPRETKDVLAAALASSWARTDPRQAAEWAIARGNAADRKDSSNQAAQEVFLRWVNNQPDEAITWLHSLPASSLRDALGTNASTFLAEQGDLESAMSLYRPQPGREDEEVTAQLAEMFAAKDPAQAAEWLREVPPGVTLGRASQTVVDAWYARDPFAAARWVESLPAGSKRDEAAQAFAYQACVDSPSTATAWVETIADSKLRGDAADWVFWRMRNDDPAGAIEWLRSLEGVDPRWKARFLRTTR